MGVQIFLFFMYSGVPYFWVIGSGIVFGIIFSLSSSHWLGVWAGLEINIICFLPLIVGKKSNVEAEAAVSYFIFQRLGSCFLVAGRLFSFNVSFTWEVDSSVEAIFIVTVGLLLKLGAAPFHWWVPGVIASLRWAICLILVTWQKVGPLLLLGRISSPAFVLIGITSACRALVGGVGGLNQTQVRALLAYSSIGHLAWIIIASVYSNQVVVVYLVLYIFINYRVFYSFWHLSSPRISSLRRTINGPMVVATIVRMLSLSGLPPFLGFIPKLIVFVVLIKYSAMWWIVRVLILGSLLSIYYYLSLCIAVFMSSLDKAWHWRKSAFYITCCSLLHLRGIIGLIYIY